MTEDERLQYFRDNIAIENKLNFEKEINGTVYKVNTYFDENAEESILNKFLDWQKNYKNHLHYKNEYGIMWTIQIEIVTIYIIFGCLKERSFYGTVK